MVFFLCGQTTTRHLLRLEKAAHETVTKTHKNSLFHINKLKAANNNIYRYS